VKIRKKPSEPTKFTQLRVSIYCEYGSL